VSSDRKGLVSQAGAVLLWETMRVTGLGRGLSESLARWRAPRAVHDPGKIVADLAAALALGGDCLAYIAVLREQPGLTGPVASDRVVSRLVRMLAGDLPRALKAIRSARAAARERAWALAGQDAPGGDGGLVTADLDATIVIAHSEKQQAAPTWKNSLNYADHRGGLLGMPRSMVLGRAVIWSSWASFCRVPVRLICSPSTSPSQPSRRASSMRAIRLSRISVKRGRWAGSGRRSGQRRPVN
jgi:hypothetical protein